jgi:hypothetical protein
VIWLTFVPFSGLGTVSAFVHDLVLGLAHGSGSINHYWINGIKVSQSSNHLAVFTSHSSLGNADFSEAEVEPETHWKLNKCPLLQWTGCICLVSLYHPRRECETTKHQRSWLRRGSWEITKETCDCHRANHSIFCRWVIKWRSNLPTAVALDFCHSGSKLVN